MTLLGEWDFACKDDLRRLTEQLRATSGATIDLTDAKFIDSSVINEIADTHNRLSACGGRLRLRIGDSRIARLLHITGIDQVIEVERRP